MKKRLNRQLYLQSLDRMTPSQRVEKAWELSNLAKTAAKEAIRTVFPEKSETEVHTLFLERLRRCHNRSY